MGDTERVEPAAGEGTEPASDEGVEHTGPWPQAPRLHSDLEKRVHVDLPRVLPEDMVATQDVDPGPDPRGGRDTDTEFMLRNAGW